MRKFYARQLLLLFQVSLLVCNITYSQQGAIDPSFNPIDIGAADAGANGIVRTLALQPDGKVIIAGDFTFFRGTARNKIARVNNDGTLDTSFDPAGGANDIIKTVLLQPDGKIIIGGLFTTFNGVPRSRLARLNANGTLDATFNPGEGSNGTINAAALQPDGKIVIAGNFTMYTGTSRNYIARVSSTGTLDPTFNPGAGANSTINTVSLQSDGKMIIGGSFTSYAGTPRIYLARVNTDGTLDAVFYPFSPGVGLNNTVNTVALQADGKVIIGGDFTNYSGINRGKIARLMTDGTLDVSFNPGTGANGNVNSAVIQPDGKIIIGGAFTLYNGGARNSVARINTNGTADSFTSSSVTFGTTHAALYQPDGKVILGGDFTGIGYRFLRLNADGTHDHFFVGIGGVGPISSHNLYPGIVRKALLAPDGKIIIGGCFMSYNGILRNNVARLNSDGTLDPSFNLGTGIFNPCVEPLAIQSDGKVIIQNTRLNTDGTVDATYNSGGLGANSLINTVYIQPNGRMLIGGGFNKYNGVNRGGVARLNSNGKLDATFTTTTGATLSGSGLTQDIPGIVNSIVLLSSGKILIGGYFTKYNGSAKTCIARLNSNGTLDNFFNVVLTPTSDVIQVMAEQPDGKILIGGQFTTVNGVSRKNIARLNSDGSLDASFNPGTGFNYAPQNIWLQPDGKMVVTGGFTTFNGVSTNGFIRLNANGTVDASFNTGTGVNNSVISSILLPDARIIIAGNFTSYNGTSKNGIARILNRFDQVITFNALANACIGSTITLTATSNSGLPVTYASSNPAIASVSGNTVTTHAVGTVTITASQPGNTTYNAAINVAQTLTVSTSLAASISGNTTICSGGSITLTANPAGAGYLWSTGATTQSITVSSAGTYSVSVTSNGCSGNASVITKMHPYWGTIYQTGELCANGYVTLTAGAGNGYAWSTGAWTQQVNVYWEGSYEVTYYSLSGCLVYAQIYVSANPTEPGYPCNSVRVRNRSDTGEVLPETNDVVTSLTIYPNPASHEITIHIPEESDADINITLFDLTGRQLNKAVLEKGKTKATLTVYDLDPSLYLVQLESGGRLIAQRKVMVVHEK